MTGIGGIGSMASAAGGNPLNGLGGTGGLSGGSGPLSGLADSGMGLGEGGGTGGAGSGMGIMPAQSATESQGASFGDALKAMTIEKPSASKKYAGELTARFAAGDTSIDPHQIALANAKAGVEIQMATRTISSAVSAVRTLFQMQV
jgi:flagellar hook-basal body complex protein FliE